MKEMSNLYKYSIGIIARDIEEDSKFVEIFPVENQTYTDGEIDSTEDIVIDNEDIYGNKQKILIPKRVTVVAEWLVLGNSNRISAPNVKKGEEVIIYRYADTDRFYWVTMFNELDLRRKEKVIHYYGNTDLFKEELNEENTYWTKIDTINKKVHLHTSDNDGELTTYDIEIDTKAGVLKITDGKNNKIQLDSSTDKLSVNINKDMEITVPNLTFNIDKFTINNGNKTEFKGGVVKHDGISIDKNHIHTGDSGDNTDVPKN